MRALLFVLIIAVLAIIAAIASGYLDINQIRGAKAPEVALAHNGVVAKGGQAPAFDVETGTVKLGTKDTTVRVPAVEVAPANQAARQTQNES
jgi:hypothetical protein